MFDKIDPSPLLILGCGYVGSAVLKVFPKARITRRSDFELARKETWRKELFDLPPHGKVLWTFPAATNPEEEFLAIEFYERYLKNFKVVIYGTTSAYLVQSQDPWVTEESALDLSQVRTRTEEELRHRGACILQLAGIFGPERDPLRWYQKGYIQTGLSYLNLIHLRDIVSITAEILKSSNVQGERFNLSNGNPRTHQEIVEELKQRGLLPSGFSLPNTRKPDSKRISNEKMRKLLSLNNEDFISFP